MSPGSTRRLGITTPIVTLNPRGHGAWERDASPADLVAVAQTAERLGFHHLTCSEHVAVPAELVDVRGTTYWDPLATLSFLAASTSTIRLATHVLVLGYHHPWTLAKQYGTLDLLSGGRVILGVGVGSLREEFDLLGVDFEDRGARADQALVELRRVWGEKDVDGMAVSPTSPRPDVPIWVGGRTRRSLRRALEHGSGWAPFGMTDEQIRAALDGVELPEGFDVVLWAYGVDPLGDPTGTQAVLASRVDLGATIVNVRLLADSLDHWVEQAERLAELNLAR